MTNMLNNKNSNALLSDPETHISLLLARSPTTQPRRRAARAGTVVWPAAAANAAAYRQFDY